MNRHLLENNHEELESLSLFWHLTDIDSIDVLLEQLLPSLSQFPANLVIILEAYDLVVLDLDDELPGVRASPLYLPAFTHFPLCVDQLSSKVVPDVNDGLVSHLNV